MSILGVTFHWYGLLIGVGVLAAAHGSAWLARRRNINEEVVWQGLWWGVIPGIIGARAYHVADLWSEIYRHDPLSVIAVWNGGLAILGGLIGGTIGLFAYYQILGRSKYKLKSFNSLLDVIFFGLPLGQAIGRIGNFINQEVYGAPTTLPWAIEISPSRRLAEWKSYSTFHPLFAYEALWLLAGFFFMYRLVLRKTSPPLVGTYLIWYGVGRFFLEYLRPAEFVWFWGDLNLAQLFSIFMVISGLILIRFKKVLARG